MCKREARDWTTRIFFIILTQKCRSQRVFCKEAPLRNMRLANIEAPMSGNRRGELCELEIPSCSSWPCSEVTAKGDSVARPMMNQLLARPSSPSQSARSKGEFGAISKGDRPQNIACVLIKCSFFHAGLCI